jgi:anti-sigma regulatory factor (Ser/Thr protein kinase)
MVSTRQPAGVEWFRYDAELGTLPPRTWRRDLLPVLTSALGHEAAAEDVVVAAGELVANAIEHGGGVLNLHVDARAGKVRLEVYDRRPVLTSPTASNLDRGRGLAMVEVLSDDWGWMPVPGGKVVWANFSTPGRSAG